MWIILEVLICLLVVFAAVFFAGKKIGERQYLRTREEMKSLELAFNQLLEEMEMVSRHNLKLMEAKTNELQELLPIIDKKTLYVRDLLDEVEEKKKLPSTNPALSGHSSTSATSAPDPRMEREIEDLRSMVTTRLQGMENQLSLLAEEFHRIVKQLSDSLPSASDLEQIPRLQREVERISDDCRRLVSFKKEFEQLAIALEPSPIETELFEATLPSSMTPLNSMADHILPNSSLLKRSSGNDPLEQRATMATEMSPEDRQTTESASMEAGVIVPAQAASSGPSLSPQQQSRSHEIFSLVDQGITIPQIARRLCMVPGEVELIINIFGPRPTARRATYR